jgi:GIY-YIG catalytic domain
MTWRGFLQAYGTRAWAYRVGLEWVFGELTSDELMIFRSLSPYRSGTSQKGIDTVRFPIHGGVWFAGGRPTCYVTYFARCIIRIRTRLLLGVFPVGISPVQNESGYGVFYPTEPGIYKAYLWKDQIEEAEIVGCEVEVIEGYGWRVLTPPTKTPPRLYSEQERVSMYVIADELTKEAYIGHTDDLRRRRLEHRRDTEDSPKVRMIQNLIARGLELELQPIEEIAGKDASKRERFWISYYKSQGYKITNRTNMRFSVRRVE